MMATKTPQASCDSCPSGSFGAVVITNVELDVAAVATQSGGSADEARFHKALHDAAGVSKLAFSVPQSVYGEAMMCGILFDCSTFADWIELCGLSYFRLLLNYIVQALALVSVYQLHLWQMDAFNSGNCYDIATPLFIVFGWLFAIAVMTELIETVDMFELVLRRIPTTDSLSQHLKFKTDEEDGALKYSAGGMSPCRKAVVSLCILLPKLSLAVSLLLFGGFFLASSSGNIDLILNSLAVVFVIEVDEMIHGFLTPGTIRRIVEAMPAFETNELAPLWRFLQRTSTVWKFIASIVMVIILYAYSPECANDPCAGHTCLGIMVNA
eukprot:gnl/TRDRNA2_/TRDRNA2_177616_c3_seq3.p1 gnl/TRDRNA2_/TRDRNA2_177616_c3~~gnl/TRDRNA2_/TRDRNA2_177616_c3_seq3.p1  ORF type:complete len:325 (+),score=28.41 gnl/TRDRNA2_/TRDRNA2_177616_c3_seq3:123-1097(+)